jgi:hypothetical protein
MLVPEINWHFDGTVQEQVFAERAGSVMVKRRLAEHCAGKRDDRGMLLCVWFLQNRRSRGET